MKTISKIAFLMLMSLLTVSFLQCSSAKKLQKETPFEIGQAYYNQNDSLIHVYIPIKSNPNRIVLDSVYFRGSQAKLLQEEAVFVGEIKLQTIKKPDLIMSNAPHAEYGNEIPLPKKGRFELKENECIVSYVENNIIKYHKISNVIKKESGLNP